VIVVTSIFRTLGLVALLCCGLACVVTPEPIPVGQDAGGGVFDGTIWKGDMGSTPDSFAPLDLMPQPPPPEGDSPMGDALPTPADGALDGPDADGGGPLEAGQEGGPPEGGPLELGPVTDLSLID
jgi:hypothetical protein